MFLSRYRSLTVIRAEPFLVAKICNSATGQVMTLSQSTVKKLIAAMLFAMGTVESVLTKAERSAHSTDSNAELCTPNQPSRLIALSPPRVQTAALSSRPSTCRCTLGIMSRMTVTMSWRKCPSD